MRLVEQARFKNSFILKYSPRQGTKADALFADDVPEEVKKRRNNDLLAVQNAISQDDHRRWIGRTVEVLVEGPSKSAARHEPAGEGFGQLTGRTTCDRIVVFEGHERLDWVRVGVRHRGRRQRGHALRPIRDGRDGHVVALAR